MSGYSPLTLTRAKRLRRDMTDAERRLWAELRADGLGGKWRRQQPIGRYIADFVCQSARLIVEVDGGQHSDSEADVRRTTWLESAGYRVLRFWNHDVLANVDGVLMRIAEALAAAPLQLRLASKLASLRILSLEGRGAMHKSPLPLRERKGPAAKRWEGEGAWRCDVA